MNKTKSIEVFEDICVFNKLLTDTQKEHIHACVKVLCSLYLTPLNFFIISSKSSVVLQNKMCLYADPCIYLYSPEEVQTIAVDIIGCSLEIMQMHSLGYDDSNGFLLSDDLPNVIDNFTGYKTLVFISFDYV